MQRRERQTYLPEADEDGAPGAASPTPGEWALLALGAVRRRRLLALAVFLAVLAVTAAYYLQKKPVYRVEAKILAQRSQALPSVVRSMPDDVPARSAWEMIHRHDNLVALVHQTNLLASPAAARPSSSPGLLSRMFGRGRAAADPLEALVLALDKHLLVLTDEGTISIQLDWPDPQEAYLVVQAALHNFLEARHLQEVTAIDEVISVFQGRAAVLRKEFEDATEQARTRPAPRREAATRVRQPSEELVRLQAMLDAKKRALQDVEEFRLRRLADVQAQLDQARNTLSDAHPTVISLKKDIEALSRETPQAEALREEQRKLRKEYAERLAREGFGSTPAPLVANAPLVEPAAPQQEDPRVRDLRLQYEQMVQRINAAQVELDAARAAFKYRYNVIWPPQVPKEPVSPVAGKIFGMGILAALALAILAAVAPDLLSGRFVERWQVQRGLGLPVLGEIRRPR